MLTSISSSVAGFSPQPDTSFYTARPQIWGEYIAWPWCACLRSSFRWYSLRLPTEEWPGWVDLGGWLHTGMVTHPSTNRAWCWLTSLINQRRYQLSQTATSQYEQQIKLQFCLQIGSNQWHRSRGTTVNPKLYICPTIFLLFWPEIQS